MTAPTTRTGPVGIGIIGAGVISGTYLENLAAFADTEVLAIGDILPDVAAAKAAEYGVPAGGDVDVVLGNPDVEIVVNLTTPDAHALVARQAIAAGKHVHGEKPLSLDRESADEVIALAAAAGLRVGSAPDTFLGAGWQAVRRAVERGDVGEPLTALTLMQQPGPEAWHPNPAFLFQEGAGPLFDIGPYYITSLVQLFGAVERVAASGSKSRETRVIGSGPKAGEVFDVTVPTHVSSSLQFGGGKSATSIYSFDSPARRILLELTGTEATLGLPDPNMFDGELLIKTRDDEEWRVLETTVATSSRGTGVLDLARAIREGRPHRASGELGRHVLDTMVSTAEAVDSRGYVEVTSAVEPAELLPTDWDPMAATL
jgi:predicted dehydrogenase